MLTRFAGFAGLVLMGLSPAGEPGGGTTTSATLPIAPPAPREHAANFQALSDTLIRVPGAVLRLGWTDARTATVVPFAPLHENRADESREGDARWFGSPARAALTFRDHRLAEVRMSNTAATPRLANYVPDELLRLGYRRIGLTITGPTAVSDWEGPAKIRLSLGPKSVVAEISPRSRAAQVVAAASPAAASPAERASGADAGGADAGEPPAMAELDFTPGGAADSLPAPRRAFTPPDPLRPRLAVEAGVFGRVQVRARIDTAGNVVHAEIARGIAELNNAALGWVSTVRFEPYRWQGRLVPFVVMIPASFLPVKSGATGTP